MSKFLCRVSRDETGVTAVEYSLIILLVVVGIVSFVGLLGSATNRPFVTANNAINGTSSP